MLNTARTFKMKIDSTKCAGNSRTTLALESASQQWINRRLPCKLPKPWVYRRERSTIQAKAIGKVTLRGLLFVKPNHLHCSILLIRLSPMRTSLSTRCTSSITLQKSVDQTAAGHLRARAWASLRLSTTTEEGAPKRHLNMWTKSRVSSRGSWSSNS